MNEAEISKRGRGRPKGSLNKKGRKIVTLEELQVIRRKANEVTMERYRTDPEFKEYINTYQRNYQRIRISEDPDFRKRRYDSTRRSLKKRYHADPDFRQKTKDYEKVFRLMKVLRAFFGDQVWEPLGCTPRQFVEHIESKFQPGMNWGNYGKWVLDHKNPICAGGTFYYCNLQPLWRVKNQEKLIRDKKKSIR